MSKFYCLNITLCATLFWCRLLLHKWFLLLGLGSVLGFRVSVRLWCHLANKVLVRCVYWSGEQWDGNYSPNRPANNISLQGLVNNVICLEFCKSSSHNEISDNNRIYDYRWEAVHCEALANTVRLGTWRLFHEVECATLKYWRLFPQSNCCFECSSRTRILARISRRPWASRTGLGRTLATNVRHYFCASELTQITALLSPVHWAETSPI